MTQDKADDSGDHGGNKDDSPKLLVADHTDVDTGASPDGSMGSVSSKQGEDKAAGDDEGPRAMLPTELEGKGKNNDDDDDDEVAAGRSQGEGATGETRKKVGARVVPMPADDSMAKSPKEAHKGVSKEAESKRETSQQSPGENPAEPMKPVAPVEVGLSSREDADGASGQAGKKVVRADVRKEDTPPDHNEDAGGEDKTISELLEAVAANTSPSLPKACSNNDENGNYHQRDEGNDTINAHDHEPMSPLFVPSQPCEVQSEQFSRTGMSEQQPWSPVRSSSENIMNIDSSKYPSSCIVKLPTGAAAGDQLTIRWPTLVEETQKNGNSSGSVGDNVSNSGVKRKAAEKAALAGKRSKRSKSGNKDVSIKMDSSSSNLVKITIPSKIKSKMKDSNNHIRVFAPWITTKRAASNTLTTQQFRSIGMDVSHDNANLRRSRRQQVRNHGEGNFSVGHSRIGERYQVSNDCVPSSDTWKREQDRRRMTMEGSSREEEVMATEAKAENDQMWDAALYEEARGRGEDVDQYIDSLQTYHKARGVMALHQSGYRVSLAERRFNHRTATAAGANIPFPDKPEPAGKQCQKAHAMLEGEPLSQEEQATFNNAIHEYRKQWPKIARAVGTSLNRCLIHYYSSYKHGEGRANYLKRKKLWEQSDECEICNDGGDLLCCDGCINAYHVECIQPPLKEVPVGQWFCIECEKKRKKINKA